VLSLFWAMMVGRYRSADLPMESMNLLQLRAIAKVAHLVALMVSFWDCAELTVSFWDSEELSSPLAQALHKLLQDMASVQGVERYPLLQA
jgi:hypothetical protein